MEYSWDGGRMRDWLVGVLKNFVREKKLLSLDMLQTCDGAAVVTRSSGPCARPI